MAINNIMKQINYIENSYFFLSIHYDGTIIVWNLKNINDTKISRLY